MNGIITSSYGKRTNPVLKKEELHDGIDIACIIGTPVKAVANGQVIATGVSKTYGNYVKYTDDNGYTIMYAHLSKILVKRNDKIKQGQTVALSGNTGLTTGAHLHFSAWKDEVSVDPMQFVTLSYTKDVVMEYLYRMQNVF